MKIDFFFDPICPWCWITSRWITEVSPQRDLEVSWRSFSLFEKNKDNDLSDEIRASARASRDMLRVVEAVRASDDALIAPLYTELGTRIHHDHVSPPNVDVGDVLDSVGIARSFADAATDTAWDSSIDTSMQEALKLAGDDVGVPLITFDGTIGFFGPVITPAPHGEAALELWDALSLMARQPGFYELKRSQRVAPEVGERPQSKQTAAH